jgi:hypothetical protein
MNVEELSAAATSISALVGYDRGRLEALASWLWEQRTKLVTPDALAKDCSVIDTAHAILVYRLLVRSGALQEVQPGRGALVKTPYLVSGAKLKSGRSSPCQVA